MKSKRQKGKISLSRYFQELKVGDRVAVIKDKSLKSSFPDRIQGDTGIVEAIRGKAYIVKLMDFNEEKRYIIQAAHLKKIPEGQNNRQETT